LAGRFRRHLFWWWVSLGTVGSALMDGDCLPSQRLPWQRYSPDDNAFVGPLTRRFWMLQWWRIEGTFWRILIWLGVWDTDPEGWYRKGHWTVGQPRSKRQAMYWEKYSLIDILCNRVRW
jgi:hypothetical protein